MIVPYFHSILAGALHRSCNSGLYIYKMYKTRIYRHDYDIGLNVISQF